MRVNYYPFKGLNRINLPPFNFKKLRFFSDAYITPFIRSRIRQPQIPSVDDTILYEKYRTILKGQRFSKKYMKPFDTFIFTHIPKCGGVSFRHYIYEAAVRSKIGTEKIYIPGENYLYINKNLLQLSKRELKRFRRKKIQILANHSYYNTHLLYDLPNFKNPFYYTILREPINRFISHYNFFNYKNGNQGCKGISLNDLPTEKLIAIAKKLGNVHTRYISGIDKLKEFGEKDALSIAKHNLEFGYADFSILENIETDLIYLSNKSPEWLKIQPKDFPIMNQNKLKVSLETSVLDIIRQYNQLDIALYLYALLLKG